MPVDLVATIHPMLPLTAETRHRHVRTGFHQGLRRTATQPEDPMSSL